MSDSDKKEHNTLKANVREVCKGLAGREVIYHILSLCDIYSDCFTGNSTTFYNEGKRRVGLDILELLEEADPGLYITLLKHNLEKINA